MVGSEPHRDDAAATRLLRRFVVVSLLANVIGSFSVFACVRFVIAVPSDDPDAFYTRNLVALVVYMAVTAVLGSTIAARDTRATGRWIDRPYRVDAAAYVATLRLPIRQAAVNAVFWVVAIPVFSVLNHDEDAGTQMIVAVSIGVGAVITCAFAYLAAERSLRVVLARMPHDGMPRANVTPGVARRLLATWAMTTAGPVGGLGLLALGRHIGVIETSAESVLRSIVELSAFSLVVGAIGIAVTAKSVAEPVTRVAAAMGEVEDGRYDTRVSVHDGSEIGRLQDGFNRMAGRVAERDRLRSMFAKHVGSSVVDHAMGRPQTLGGATVEAAVVFIDITGSTTLAERVTPEEMVIALNRFFTAVVEVTATFDGLVDKFEGDAALVVFGVPTPTADAPDRALGMARAMADRLPFEDTLDAGVGVAFGPVVAGNIGADDRFEYTVIGDPVNTAARLSDLAKDRPGRVVCTAATRAAADRQEASRWVDLDTVTLRGRSQPTAVCEIASRPAPATSAVGENS